MIVTVTLNPSLDEWVEIDRLRLGRLHRAVRFVRYPGGKGINVSRVVHELGGQTLAVGLAGGRDGQILSDLLHERRIAHRFLHVPGATRNNYEILTTHPPALTQINCPGPKVAPSTMAQMRRLLLGLRPCPRAVVFSGSTPPGVPASCYRQLLRALQPLGILTVLDSSGSALRSGLIARPWLIKPNRDEAEELLGRRLRSFAQIVSAAKALVRRGPSLAIISLGPEGAVLASVAHAPVWHGRSPAVKVHSTVGAGDALVAGFVMGYLATRALPEAFRLGLACGTATVLTSGTELCHRRDVKRLLPQIRLRPVQ